MSFEIIEISKTEKQAKFKVSEEEVSNGFIEVAKLYQKDADEKGFRKGILKTINWLRKKTNTPSIKI